jgi:transcriptional regulator with XRE-family HTH domain
VIDVKERHMNLRAARQRRGWSLYDLADRTGVAAPNISALETGSRIMGKRLASKFAKHLDANSAELVIGNRLVAMDRAMKRKDAEGVLAAARSMVETTEAMELTDKDEDLFDRLVHEALALAKKVGSEGNKVEGRDAHSLAGSSSMAP